MPVADWQVKRNKLRAPHPKLPAIPVSLACAGCAHPRSSHSGITLFAPCRSAGCGCPVYDATCICKHLLSAHMWSTRPTPFACADCECRGYGLVAPEAEIAQSLF